MERAEIVPPQAWRVLSDERPGAECFIPTDGSPRSRRIFERVQQMTPEDAARIAAQYLEDHAPDDPTLEAYRSAVPEAGTMTDLWDDPANHPTALAPHNTEPAINGMTLRRLVEWAEANGHDPDNVQVDYADCGTHRVVLYVRQASDDVPTDVEPDRV